MRQITPHNEILVEEKLIEARKDNHRVLEDSLLLAAQEPAFLNMFLTLKRPRFDAAGKIKEEREWMFNNRKETNAAPEEAAE